MITHISSSINTLALYIERRTVFKEKQRKIVRKRRFSRREVRYEWFGFQLGFEVSLSKMTHIILYQHFCFSYKKRKIVFEKKT